ncbi:MAG: DUF503 domain-containing protein [Deltaproteobacteria bacterium]|nr:DUF503 domain-containing protein [Deltaproteobacteria bacterium]
MKIVAGKIAFFFPECHSLKEKRHFVQKLKEKTSHQFGVPVAEVDQHDLWQRAVLGFAIVGNEIKPLQRLADQIIRFMETLDLGQIIDKETELMEF